MKKVFQITLLIIFLSGLIGACTAIAVGKKATSDGSVIVSQTDTGADSRIFRVAAKRFKPGEMAPVYLDIQDVNLPLHDDGRILGYIPQVEQTYAYFHSAYSHINEHQLAMAESTLSQRDELVVTPETGKQIMTIEQAMIFALQRHRKSREATAFIGDLMTRYGFLPSCADGSESLMIGDTEEVWIFEVFSVGPGWTPESGKPGAIWAARRLGDDQVTMIPNWSIIKEINLDKPDEFMASSNYMQDAIDRGWYTASSGKPFIWQDVYSPLPAEWATSRFWSFHHRFAPKAVPLPDRTLKNDPYAGLNQYVQTVEPLSLYPFSVKPEQKISVQDIMAFQRSVHEGTIYDMSEDPAWYHPDGKGGMQKSPLATPFPSGNLRKLLRITNRRPVARHRGEYGMIAQLRGWLPPEIGGVYYVYLDNPYFSPYLPIYTGNLSVHPSYSTYSPKVYDKGSARWAYDFVDNLAALGFEEARQHILSRRAPFEQELFQAMNDAEAKALTLEKKSSRSAQESLTKFSHEWMSKATSLFLSLRNELIVKLTNNRE